MMMMIMMKKWSRMKRLIKFYKDHEDNADEFCDKTEDNNIEETVCLRLWLRQQQQFILRQLQYRQPRQGDRGEVGGRKHGLAEYDQDQTVWGGRYEGGDYEGAGFR